MATLFNMYAQPAQEQDIFGMLQRIRQNANQSKAGAFQAAQDITGRLAEQKKREGYGASGDWSGKFEANPERARFDFDVSRTQEAQDIARTRAENVGASAVYTPEQKQLIDAKHQNGIQLGRAISALNTSMQRFDDEQIAKWDQQVKELQAVDDELIGKLAASGVSGYSAQSTAQPQAATQAEETNLDKNSTARIKFMSRYAPKKLAEVPSESQIMADAMDSGYTISRRGAGLIKDELAGKVQAGISDLRTSLETTEQKERMAQGRIEDAYKRIDLKYPGLRTEGIDLVNTAITFVESGDKGDNSARNNLVKKIARMGSNEALSETDFGRALGRDLGAAFASRIAGAVTGQGLPITDAEWSRLKAFARDYAEEMRNSVKDADPSGKLLRPIKPWPLLRSANDGKTGAAPRVKITGWK